MEVVLLSSHHFYLRYLYIHILYIRMCVGGEGEGEIIHTLIFQALDGFLMIVDHVGTVLYVSDDSAEYINLTPVSLCLTARTI